VPDGGCEAVGAAGATATPGGGPGMFSPSFGAGRLVPGTQDVPFQYRM
jgi:hypothetical protein